MSTDSPRCTASSQLTAATQTITTLDASPNGPVLAASTSGSNLLAVWIDGGGTVNDVPVPETIWAAGLALGSSGADVAAPLQLAADGHCPVAAAAADGFAVAWADATGIQLQQLDVRGAARGKASLVAAVADPDACPSSLLDTSDGVVVAWYEPHSTNQVVARLDPGGGIAAQLMLDQVPSTASALLTLLSLHAQTFVASVRWSDDTPASVISAIDWSKGLVIEQSVTPGFLGTFFASGDDLVLGIQGTQPFELYAGSPGESPHVWAREAGGWFAAADACGRIVVLGTEGPTPAGFAAGFFAEGLDPATPKIALGGVSEAALTGAGAGFGMLWYSRIGPRSGFPGPAVASATGTLNFTTLTW